MVDSLEPSWITGFRGAAANLQDWSEGATRGRTVLHIWPLPDFRPRLSAMRDLYVAQENGDDVAVLPLERPQDDP